MKPIVVEIDYTRPDRGKPHWNLYLFGWSISSFAFVLLAAGLFDREWRGPLAALGGVLSFVGAGFIHLACWVRETHQSRMELTKLVAEQSERIRKLEEQVAALTAEPVTTH